MVVALRELFPLQVYTENAVSRRKEKKVVNAVFNQRRCIQHVYRHASSIVEGEKVTIVNEYCGDRVTVFYVLKEIDMARAR